MENDMEALPRKNNSAACLFSAGHEAWEEKMSKRKNPDLCSLCGGTKQPGTATFTAERTLSVTRTRPGLGK